MTDVILTAAGVVALALFVRWLTKPDPLVVRQTKERQEMRIRDDASSRWDL